MFDSYQSDAASGLDTPIDDYEPIEDEAPHWACGKVNCDCDEQTMAAMEDYDNEEDYQRDQTAARETILNGDY